MDYEAWDTTIQNAILALPEAKATERPQLLIRQFPGALSSFRKTLDTTELAMPLADFQRHPTYLLRFLLSEWRDEAAKAYRTDLRVVLKMAADRLAETQRWRAGGGDNWADWGYRDMDHLYAELALDAATIRELEGWYPQRFFDTDARGRPIHVEVLPSNFRPELLSAWVLRRVVNNEHTLRHRIPQLNPPPGADAAVIAAATTTERPDPFADPVLGGTWVVDAGGLSFWAAGAAYKTATAIVDRYVKVNSRHFPEQGYRAVVCNLGVVFGTLYNVLMAVMPPTVQRTTQCYIGAEPLATLFAAGARGIPRGFLSGGGGKKGAAGRLTPEEEAHFAHDQVPCKEISKDR